MIRAPSFLLQGLTGPVHPPLNICCVYLMNSVRGVTLRYTRDLSRLKYIPCSLCNPNNRPAWSCFDGRISQSRPHSSAGVAVATCFCAVHFTQGQRHCKPKLDSKGALYQKPVSQIATSVWQQRRRSSKGQRKRKFGVPLGAEPLRSPLVSSSLCDPE